MYKKYSELKKIEKANEDISELMDKEKENFRELKKIWKIWWQRSWKCL